MNIRIPSDIKLVHITSSQILDHLKSLNIEEGVLFDIRFSLEEALINAIKHGNDSSQEKSVEIDLNNTPSSVEITIKDEGRGFDFKRLPDPTIPENLERGSGRGVYLIQKLMDRVEFLNNGKSIRMIKFLHRG